MSIAQTEWVEYTLPCYRQFDVDNDPDNRITGRVRSLADVGKKEDVSYSEQLELAILKEHDEVV